MRLQTGQLRACPNCFRYVFTENHHACGHNPYQGLTHRFTPYDGQEWHMLERLSELSDDLATRYLLNVGDKSLRVHLASRLALSEPSWEVDLDWVQLYADRVDPTIPLRWRTQIAAGCIIGMDLWHMRNELPADEWEQLLDALELYVKRLRDGYPID